MPSAASKAPPPSLGAYARPQLPRFALGALCLLASNGMGLLIPWLLKRAIDALHTQQPDALTLTARLSLVIIGLAALQAGVRTASRVLIFNGGRDVEYRLRRDLFEHVVRLPQSFHRAHPTGELMSRLTNDLSAVRMLFGPGVLNVVNTPIVYLTGIWLMAAISPRLTVFALLPLPLVVTIAQLASRRVYHRSRELQNHMGTLSTHLQEDLTGIAVMRGYTLEAQRERAFAALNDEYLARSLALARTRGMLGPIFAVAGGIGTLVVLWMGGKLVILGHMSVGELVAFSAYLAYLAWPTLALGWVLSMWQRGLAGWHRVRELLTTPVESEGDGGAAARGRAALEARELRVEHGGRAILDGVSFEVAPGQNLAIVGPTGSGKTTLADALLRLVDVPAGTLFVDGHDVTAMPLSTLRRRMAYAPQDPFLFSATVAENIAFGRHDEDTVTPAGVRAAAEDAGLSRDLGELPDGIDTVVGERGITLSGGQRQRVALARALYADAPVVILDDSLSSVDAETEQDILARLRPKLQGRTAVIISHRIAAVRHADHILVLEGGRISERGSHAELCERGGTYARLYREQLADETPAGGAA